MNPSAFREIVRTVTVSYPIPFLFAGLIAAMLFCFGAAMVVREALMWAFTLTGVASFAATAGLGIYAVVWRPELLRSERFTLASRYIDMLDDGDMDEATRAAVAKTFEGFAEPTVPKKRRTSPKGES